MSPRVGAHRGAMGYEPENTLAAFERAIAQGTWRIELDVRRSRDGVLVVLHDDTVDRTTDGSGAVAELAWARLRTLTVGTSERLPTLSQTLELARDRVRLLVEVKDHAAVDDIVTVIRAAGMTEACTISCFDEGVLRRAKALAPDLATAWFHLQAGPLDVPYIAESVGVSLLIVWPPGADADQIAAARAAGLDVRAGLPDHLTYEETAEEVSRLVAKGVNEVSCGRPDWIARAIAG